MNKVLLNLTKFTEQQWHYFIYNIFILLSLILMGLSVLDITTGYHKYVGIIDTIIKYYIGIILIVRFNPYNECQNTIASKKFDRTLAFSAGLLLVSSETIKNVLIKYFLNIKNFFM